MRSPLSQYDTMTKTPVRVLVIRLGLPTTVSMLVTNIYNVADTSFVGQLGTSASGAVGVVFGLMAILQAFGFMLGHGAGSNIARHLGAQEVEDAKRYASTSFYLALAAGVVIMVIGLCNLDGLCRLLGSTETILPYARIYAACILIAGPAMTTSCVMNNILRYEGMATLAMIGLTLGGVVNIFGDWLLMFGAFHLGILGAGLSTTISQYLSAIVLFFMFHTGRTQSSFHPKYISTKPLMLKNIITVGFPSMIRQGLTALSTMVLNISCGPYGDAAVAAMSICARIINFLWCVGLGIGQGFQPVSAFNYGARAYRRVRDAYRFTVLFGTVLLSDFAVLGFIFAPSLVRLLRDDPQVVAIGAFALRAQCATMVCLGFTVASNMLFQSIGKSLVATILALMRSGLCFIPLLLVLTRTMGLRGIQLAQPLADVATFILTIPFVLQFFSRLPREDQPAPHGPKETQ
ncbi:MAG: MATE family efflux transporter [Sphaerochaeta sp.]|jgi:putative MATE family efflux protein|nr:MATE family efflux transporter [Sphaerochaeta sp.]MCH3919797.1 MATE family efflux transporter [Sphaerochaeta sp.]MCI2045703.1 MATE family efflux transporter [Sphaerochaeta sp.]MCI2076441.1 MATE family efflux transporter [Sphaerochaeta sp.]MCI2096639.1 MATE family efflux transporter [Sphaerochaeta sp.]